MDRRFSVWAYTHYPRPEHQQGNKYIPMNPSFTIYVMILGFEGSLDHIAVLT